MADLPSLSDATRPRRLIGTIAGVGVALGATRLHGRARLSALLAGGAVVAVAWRPATADLADPDAWVEVRRTATAACTPADAYAFWNDPANLERVVPNAVSIAAAGPDRQRWTVRAMRRKLRWESEIVERTPDRRIAWRTTEDADVPSEGSIALDRAPRDLGTEIVYTLRHRPPLGKAGTLVARAFGEDPATLMQRTLHNVKALLEAGELSTNAITAGGVR